MCIRDRRCIKKVGLSFVASWYALMLGSILVNSRAKQDLETSPHQKLYISNRSVQRLLECFCQAFESTEDIEAKWNTAKALRIEFLLCGVGFFGGGLQGFRGKNIDP